MVSRYTIIYIKAREYLPRLYCFVWLSVSEIGLKTYAEHLLDLQARRTGGIVGGSEEYVVIVYHVDLQVGGKPAGEGIVELYVPVDIDVLRLVEIVGVEVQSGIQ